MSRFKKATLLILVFTSTFVVSQSIPATDAGKHIGERGTVCGTITDTHTAAGSRGGPTFIDLDGKYPLQAFTAVIWQAEKRSVGEVPGVGKLCVTGLVTEYKGKPQITLHGRSDWSVSSPMLSNNSHYTNNDGNVVHSPAYSFGGVPTGATAQCSDGTYSFSQHRQGTCSHHGGVSRWF
jgi:hypothetical protein